jgi:hypothetical protein
MIVNRIEKLKAKLIIEQPYFGTIASNLELKLNEDIQSFQTANHIFEYNDDFINSLSDNELIFTLTNSAMHYALDYESRKVNRISWLWKLAQDYAINSLLVKNNMTKPLIANHNIRFDNLNGEKIYEILKDEIDDKQNLKDDLKHIQYKNENKTIDNNSISNANILNKAKHYDDLPLGIEILIANINDGIINWKDQFENLKIYS